MITVHLSHKMRTRQPVLGFVNKIIFNKTRCLYNGVWLKLHYRLILCKLKRTFNFFTITRNAQNAIYFSQSNTTPSLPLLLIRLPNENISSSIALKEKIHDSCIIQVSGKSGYPSTSSIHNPQDVGYQCIMQ